MTEACPRCGNRPDGTPPNICTPYRCDAWKFTHRFNHETREWDPVEESLPVPELG